jgi:hypothetical protein
MTAPTAVAAHSAGINGDRSVSGSGQRDRGTHVALVRHRAYAAPSQARTPEHRERRFLVRRTVSLDTRSGHRRFQEGG